ncbi:MAG: hypothetical protein GY827_07045 [Cytophagales bacterium]|nr:hypothetical protein [Cytophagales bacterium]
MSSCSSSSNQVEKIKQEELVNKVKELEEDKTKLMKQLEEEHEKQKEIEETLSKEIEKLKDENTAFKEELLVLPLKGEKGFITQKQGGEFLKYLSLLDILSTNDIKENDIIGKYYKIEKTGNYLVCFSRYCPANTFGDHPIVEVSSTGKYVRHEVFRHGNYCSCWSKEPFSGFNKYGEFFEFSSCGTGSGHSSSHLYIFKELKSQESMKSIVEYSWSFFYYAQYLRSNKQYNENHTTGQK